MFQKLERTKKVIKAGKISEKYDILKVEEKRIPLIGNKSEGNLEMSTV